TRPRPLARDTALPRPAPARLHRTQLQAPRRARPGASERHRRRTGNGRARPPLSAISGKHARPSHTRRLHPHRRQPTHHPAEQLELPDLPQLTSERPPEAVLGRPPNGTNAVPASKWSPTRSPTANASRVLPIPPGPVNVTSATSGCWIRLASS